MGSLFDWWNLEADPILGGLCWWISMDLAVCRKETWWAYFCLKWAFWAASSEKKINYEFSAAFEGDFLCFHGQKFNFWILCLHALKSFYFLFVLNREVFSLGYFFVANCFGYFDYYIKGCLSATHFFSLLSLVQSLTCSTAVFLYLFIDKKLFYIF